MENFNLKINLKTIGKSAFVELFDDVKNNIDIKIIKEKFKKYNWSDSTLSTKLSTAKAIFDREDELEALRIIKDSCKVDIKTRDKAEQIFNSLVDSEDIVEEVIDVDDTNIHKALLKYATSIGFEESEINELLVQAINEKLQGDRCVKLKQVDNSTKLIVAVSQEPTLVHVDSPDKLSKFDMTAVPKIDNSSKAQFKIDSKKFKTTFKSRLETQNRKYANSYTYYPTIFKKLDIGFNDIINQQLSKIFTYIKEGEGYKRKDVNEFDVIKFKKGKLYGVIGKIDNELYFNIDKSYYTFEGYVSEFREVSLAHTKSMYNIISDLRTNLPLLEKMSGLLKNLSVADIKLKINSDKSAAQVKNTVCVKELRKEIELIEKEVDMQLMPLKINISMGKN